MALLGFAAGASSCLANCATAVMEVPLDTVRLQMQAGTVRGNMGRLLLEQASKGPRQLWNGLSPFLLRTVPQDALQFMLFAAVRPVCPALPRGCSLLNAPPPLAARALRWRQGRGRAAKGLGWRLRL